MFPESLMKLKQLPSRERERKKEEIYLQRCLLRERRKRPEAGGRLSRIPGAIKCPDPVLGCTGPPVLTFEEHRRAHGLFSPRLGGSCAFPSNHLERRANSPAVGGLAFTAHKRAGCSPEPRWESGIINRSYRGLEKNAGLHGV